MKIAFDEHVPSVMVKVFKALAKDGHIIKAEFVSARDYAVPGITGTDVPWLTNFARDGGTVVFSGDKRMSTRPHERKAYTDAKFKLFFFEPKWNNGNGFAKSALLIRWWQEIETTIRESAPGQCCEIQMQWKAYHHVMVEGRKRRRARSKEKFLSRRASAAAGRAPTLSGAPEADGAAPGT
jgi:hypothetical protein